ncbi:amidohydrolase [Blastococcus saxobsidens]|uniref:Amidohydrolase n=1 Tax=Blastococcus saxobsidens (strain DD2) TaxID=1146883 RepID=H6RX12_BLASD|nr:amidohydrolase [Blastococcus saxobsidens]CCG03420.1 Amidohydrolase [Blastococcus saxobsidens DD2]
MLLDALYVNGRFTTLDPQRPTATAIGVVGGVIVGLDEELDGCQAELTVDLAGAPVVPGLHDAHQHLSARGQELQMCDVSPAAVRTLDDVYAAVGRHAATLARDAWVLATGLDVGKLDDAPTREGLDAVSGGRPVWVLHASHHAGIASTGAIRRIGFADPRQLSDVDGGWIERRPDGDPTGLITERAMTLIFEHVRPQPFEEFVEAIGLASRAALADGLTSVTEPGISGRMIGNSASDLAAFMIARDRGLLGVRMTLMPEISALHEVDGDTPLGLDLGLRSGLGDDWLRIGAVKIISDGALTARTAALCCDYADRPGGRGLLLDDAGVLTERILAAHRAGWQIGTHAIGDAAVEVVLDAYERAQQLYPRTDPRHRIEHCGLTNDRQIERVKQLGVVPVPQGRFVTELGDSYVTALGRERAELLYRQRSFLDAGIEVPGSSDCPVVDGSPLLGIHSLVNRQLPDGTVLNPAERLTPLQALRTYTLGSAYADHSEHRKGTLSRGKLADFVVLSGDLLAVAPGTIGDLSVVATVVGGVVRHGADLLTSR